MKCLVIGSFLALIISLSPVQSKLSGNKFGLYCVVFLCISGQTTDGNNFFIAFPKSSFLDEELTILITTQHEGTVHVLVQSLRGHSNLTSFRSDTTLVLKPPENMEVLGKEDYNKGIRVRPFLSNQKISVSVMKNARSSSLSGTYLALPPVVYTNLQEYVYYITSYYWNNRIQTNYSSTVLLVGTQDNTSVTITPSQRIEIPPHFIRDSYPLSVLNAGESYTVTLQPMETFHVESVHDLTGTRIVSNKPVTVLGSHECTDIPVGVRFCDFIVEQFPPTVNWGRFFLLASPHSRLTGERYKVVALKSYTSVKVKCVVESQSRPELGHVVMFLNASGEIREFELGRDRLCSVVSNKPILLVQYSLGYSLDQVGDPFMLVIPPVKQFKNNFTVMAPRSYHNHLTIVVPLEFFDSSRIFLNGSTITGWSPIYCSDSTTCGHGVRLSVPPGTHRVRHADPNATLMVYEYGFEYHDGYGQIAGMSLKRIASKSLQLTGYIADHSHHVTILPDLCEHGDLRLDPFLPDVMSGVVEVCLDGVWTSVSGDGWSSLEASVTCRQLGYSQGK